MKKDREGGETLQTGFTPLKINRILKTRLNALEDFTCQNKFIILPTFSRISCLQSEATRLIKKPTSLTFNFGQ